MKHPLNKILAISIFAGYFSALLPSCSDGCGCCALPVKAQDCFKRNCGYPLTGYRSQSLNLARRIVNTPSGVNKYGMNKYNSNSFMAVEYTRSFNPEKILTNLLGTDATDCNILIQGSKVQDRNSQAWLADYFGLPMDFNSKICLKPVIQNAIVDLNWYAGLDNWLEGMFVRLYAPIVYTNWNLNMCEIICDYGQDCFPMGYMNKCGIIREALPADFTNVMKGCTTFGDMQSPIKYGLFTPIAQTDTKLADLRAEIGWNFCLEEDYHIGLAFHVAAPTGTRPTGYYIFEPIVGNGKHWELGAGITASWVPYRNVAQDKYLGFYFDGIITNMLKACQNRSFDFACKTNSRYMLLEEMESGNTTLGKCSEGQACLTTGTTCCSSDCSCLARYVYSGNLVPAINVTTQCVYSKIDVQADLALKASYYHKNWGIDLGYNFWVRSGEKFYKTEGCNDKVYALKGDSYIYGSINIPTQNEDSISSIINLSATQSTSDIHAGKNYPLKPGEVDATALCNAGNNRISYNPRIDNPYPAYSQGYPLTDVYECPVIGDTPNENTSVQPIIIRPCDIDMQKSPKAYSNKVFGHFNYNWFKENNNKTPYLGFGAEAEFAGGGKCCKNGCGQNIAVSQWGAWVKTGFTFE